MGKGLVVKNMEHENKDNGGQSLRTPGMLAWLRLARIFQKIDRRSSAHVRTWNLSMARFDVLAQIGTTGGLTQCELAERLLVTRGNVTQVLDGMERDGLLIRRKEGRVNRLFLTEHGCQLRETVVPAQEALIAEQLSALSVTEQRQLLTLLRTLDHALD